MISSNGWTVQPDEAYFPDGRVASRGQAMSPVTQPVPMHGPPNMQTVHSPYSPSTPHDPPVESELEGFGRSPGQQWPHMPHVEQYSFDSASGIGWHDTHPDAFGDRIERQGWALAGPDGAGRDNSYYYGQGLVREPWNEPIAVEVPGTMPYTALTEVPS